MSIPPSAPPPPAPQDVEGCLSPAEVSEGLGLPELQHHRWHVQDASHSFPSKFHSFPPQPPPPHTPHPHPPPPAPAQDLEGCLTPAEVAERLGLPELQHHRWHVQGTVATKREGLAEGLAWLESTLQATAAADAAGCSAAVLHPVHQRQGL
jgi:hypothetical protein